MASTTPSLHHCHSFVSALHPSDCPLLLSLATRAPGASQSPFVLPVSASCSKRHAKLQAPLPRPELSTDISCHTSLSSALLAGPIIRGATCCDSDATGNARAGFDMPRNRRTPNLESAQTMSTQSSDAPLDLLAPRCKRAASPRMVGLVPVSRPCRWRSGQARTKPQPICACNPRRPPARLSLPRKDPCFHTAIRQRDGRKSTTIHAWSMRANRWNDCSPQPLQLTH
jgi:hypothetical protein